MILAHQLDGKNVLLIGGGEVGLTRLRKLISTGSKVTLVSPELHSTILKEYCQFKLDETDNIHPDWAEEGKKRSVYRVIKEEFKDEYLTLYRRGNDSGWSLILTCIPNRELSEKIYRDAKRLFGSQQIVNVADNPPLCDVYFGANLEFAKKSNQEDCFMQMMISSNGMGPRFVAMVRDEVQRMLEGIDFEKSLQKLGKLRSDVREVANKESDTKYRMEWIKKCTDTFGIKNCESIDDEKLLGLFKDMYIDDKSLDFPPRQSMLKDYLD